MYHRVAPQRAPLYEVAIHPKIFEKQIRYLQNYYQLINLPDLKKDSKYSRDKKDFVVLTFDDGYYDNYKFAFPILRKYNIPATIFVTTGYIGTNKMLWWDKLSNHLYDSKSYSHFSKDKINTVRKIVNNIKDLNCYISKNNSKVIPNIINKLKLLDNNKRNKVIDNIIKEISIDSKKLPNRRAMLSWEEIKEMAKFGIGFGSHTVSHPVLNKIPKHDAEWEIKESKEKIQNEIQKKVTTFAYPYGKQEEFSEEIIDIIKKNEFEHACTACRGSETYPIKEPYKLKRKGVHNDKYFFL
jgi:peptidoglycan/xylan/chitin deacetylase (PgdA/CDA1 family)